MNQPNGNHRLSTIDLIEEEFSPEQSGTSFYDSNCPELKPAKQIDKSKTKSWKRRLATWSFILLLIVGGAMALYLLLRVNRVNVKVQAASSREAQSNKPSTNSGETENTLTAEAINLARSASGTDTATANATASPAAAAVSSPSPPSLRTNYSFTGNTSPVYEPLTESASPGNNNQQQTNTSPQAAKPVEYMPSSLTSSRANVTQSIFVGDEAAKAVLIPSPTIPIPKRAVAENKSTIGPPKSAPPVLPPFGTMLPVRTQGVIFTLRNDSYARLELTRDIAGEGWSLPKGTVFVGRTSGNEYDRAYVNVVGFVDPRNNKLVKMTGEVMGVDGAAGLPGKRMDMDRNAFKSALSKVAASGVQVVGIMAGALGRGPVVIDGAGYRLTTPLTNEARNAITGNGSKEFVKVQAGQAAYLMVSNLPKAIQSVDAPGEDDIARAATSLTDREVMELIMFGSPDEIRSSLPLMTEEQKRLAIRTLQPENKEK